MDVIHSDSRGGADHGWLLAKHTFSFANYYDRKRLGFGSLRVINEDRVAPGQGFGTHAHRDMEIITYIIDGAIEHKDDMGNGSIIRPGDVQRMTAGTGVQHSEYNASNDDPVHLLQIWILPERNSLQPGYEQAHFRRDDRLNQWRLVGSRDGRLSSLTIHQDVDLYATILEGGAELTHGFAKGRRGFLQIVRGTVTADDRQMTAGDGAMIRDANSLKIFAAEDVEMLLFDLA